MNWVGEKRVLSQPRGHLENPDSDSGIPDPPTTEKFRSSEEQMDDSQRWENVIDDAINL